MLSVLCGYLDASIAQKYEDFPCISEVSTGRSLQLTVLHWKCLRASVGIWIQILKYGIKKTSTLINETNTCHFKFKYIPILTKYTKNASAAKYSAVIYSFLVVIWPIKSGSSWSLTRLTTQLLHYFWSFIDGEVFLM